MEEALATQNLPSCGIYSSHGIAFVPWNSSSKVSARKLPTFKSTRSAVLKNTLARQMASSSPRKVTLPSSTREISYPRSMISFFNTASMPKWHGAINSKYFFTNYSLQCDFFDNVTIKIINGKYILIQHSVGIRIAPLRQGGRTWI